MAGVQINRRDGRRLFLGQQRLDDGAADAARRSGYDRRPRPGAAAYDRGPFGGSSGASQRASDPGGA